MRQLVLLGRRDRDRRGDPERYVVRSANGFSVAVPAGWSGTPVTSGDGGIRTTLIPATGNGGQVRTEYYAQPQQTIDQRLAEDRMLATSSVAIHDVKDQVRTVGVAGAQEAKLDEETFTNAAGPAHSEELLVRTRTGAVVVVTAIVSDGSISSLDPNAVVASFRLTA